MLHEALAPDRPLGAGTGRASPLQTDTPCWPCHPAPLLSFTVPRPALSSSVSLSPSLPHTLSLMLTPTAGGEETTPRTHRAVHTPGQWGGRSLHALQGHGSVGQVTRGSGCTLDGHSQPRSGTWGSGCTWMEGDGSRKPRCPCGGAEGEERGWVGGEEHRGGAGHPTRAEPVLGAGGSEAKEE